MLIFKIKQLFTEAEYPAQDTKLVGMLRRLSMSVLTKLPRPLFFTPDVTST